MSYAITPSAGWKSDQQCVAITKLYNSLLAVAEGLSCPHEGFTKLCEMELCIDSLAITHRQTCSVYLFIHSCWT